jgi:hypothetical protein
LWQEFPDTSYAGLQDLTADLDTSSATAGNQQGQVLIRFDAIFGSGARQIPANATIHSAKLLLNTPANTSGTDFDSNDPFRVHRMVTDWNDAATWNSLVGGVSADNVEAAASASFSLVPDIDGGPAIFDVTGDVELFKAGTPNRGWVVRPSTGGSGDGWTLRSSEFPGDVSLRPTLEITYSLPSTPYAAWAISKGLTAANDSPDADPDGDGASNRAEFAYNLNPLVADAVAVPANGLAGLPAPRYLPEVSNGVLEVEFLRRRGPSAVGLTYAVTFSGNLVDWSPGETPSISILSADWERVRVRDVAGGPRAGRFARVVVTLQP